MLKESATLSRPMRLAPGTPCLRDSISVFGFGWNKKVFVIIYALCNLSNVCVY